MAGPQTAFIGKTCGFLQLLLNRKWSGPLHSLADPRRETSIFGAVHDLGGVFPTSEGIKPTADSLALQIGGGLNVGVAKHFGLSVLELYYLRTNLPNDAYNTQNGLRLDFGVSYHIGK